MDASPLVGSDWLAEHLSDPDLRVFDTTLYLDPTPSGFETRSGREVYDAKHVPGAGFLDILSELSDPASKLRFTRPDPDRLAEVLARAGISERHRVVLYSTGEVMWATRAWWLLRWLGLPAVAVLDGGLAKWEAEGRALCGEPCSYPAASLRARPVEDVWATQQQVLAAIGDGAACTINALPRPLHAGAEGLGYRRPGHIAGSENVPYSDLQEPEDGRFRPAAELREHFAPTGALERERVICYCGGGIAATQDALALVLLGHPHVAVYDGSLDEWSRDPALPMETQAAG